MEKSGSGDLIVMTNVNSSRRLIDPDLKPTSATSDEFCPRLCLVPREDSILERIPSQFYALRFVGGVVRHAHSGKYTYKRAKSRNSKTVENRRAEMGLNRCIVSAVDFVKRLN